MLEGLSQLDGLADLTAARPLIDDIPPDAIVDDDGATPIVDDDGETFILAE